VTIGAGQRGGQGHPRTIDDQGPFRAWFAAIGGIGADVVAPFLAGMRALSRLARSQSIWPASPSRSSRVRWRRSQTPAASRAGAASRSRRSRSPSPGAGTPTGSQF
jgi:hypothetical protein